MSSQWRCSSVLSEKRRRGRTLIGGDGANQSQGGGSHNKALKEKNNKQIGKCSE